MINLHSVLGVIFTTSLIDITKQQFYNSIDSIEKSNSILKIEILLETLHQYSISVLTATPAVQENPSSPDCFGEMRPHYSQNAVFVKTGLNCQKTGWCRYMQFITLSPGVSWFRKFSFLQTFGEDSMV